MKTNNNVEIKNQRMSKKQIANIKRMGLRLDKSDNTWSVYEKDGPQRRKIFDWCLDAKFNCWIRTFDYTHIIETRDGLNAARINKLKKSKKRKKNWKPKIYKWGTLGGHKKNIRSLKILQCM